MYKFAYQKLEQFPRLRSNKTDRIGPMDNKWIEQTISKSNAQLETLITEYRRQKEESVKVYIFFFI